jgi:hypothetical protein
VQVCNHNVLVIIPGLAFAAYFFLTVKHNGLDALVLQSPGRSKTGGPGADDTYWVFLLMVTGR